MNVRNGPHRTNIHLNKEIWNNDKKYLYFLRIGCPQNKRKQGKSKNVDAVIGKIFVGLVNQFRPRKRTIRFTNEGDIKLGINVNMQGEYEICDGHPRQTKRY